MANNSLTNMISDILIHDPDSSLNEEGTLNRLFTITREKFPIYFTTKLKLLLMVIEVPHSRIPKYEF